MYWKVLYSLIFCAAEFSFCLGAVAQDSGESKKAIAIVADEEIFEEQFSPSLQGQLQRMRQQEFQLKRKGLSDLVRQKLLEAAAKKKGTTAENLLQMEVDSKNIADPTPSELEAYYLAQKQHIPQPFDNVKATLKEALKQAKIQAAREAYLNSLEQQTKIVTLLHQPRLKIDYDPTRLKGDANAQIIIVEFSDFGCPFCRQSESTLKQVAAKYQGKVSLAYRDFPLSEFHPQAQLAAEASRCAGEQDKFWEYHDLLFAIQDGLSRAGLLENARKLNLDEKQFASCLETGKYKQKIAHDVQDGIRAGVSGTPAFFINGVFLDGAQPASSFEKIIDEELQSANRESAQK